MRGEVISVLSLERRYHILSRVSAANEGHRPVMQGCKIQMSDMTEK